MPTQVFQRSQAVTNKSVSGIQKILGSLLPTASGTGMTWSRHQTNCISCENRVCSSHDMARLLKDLPHTRPESPMRLQVERAVSPPRLPQKESMAPGRAQSMADPVGTRPSLVPSNSYQQLAVNRRQSDSDAYCSCGPNLPRTMLILMFWKGVSISARDKSPVTCFFYPRVFQVKWLVVAWPD